jgi:DNA-binding transcriptional regulator YdaS (Cro superfamily)
VINEEAYACDRKMLTELSLPYAVKTAIRETGGTRSLARLLNISSSAVCQWKRIPAERMLEIERATGVPRELLRPDLYRTEHLEDALEQWANR